MKDTFPKSPSSDEPTSFSVLPGWFTGQEIIPLDDQMALVVCHETMQRITEVCRRIAESPGPVLLTGETGVGKSLLSRFIHASRDPYAPFVSITTAGLAAEVLIGRIFGEGPAKDGSSPLAAEAAGGTLVLEEMGDLPHSFQARLMQAWSQGGFGGNPENTPEGGAEPIQLICTTNSSRQVLRAPGTMAPGFLERFEHLHVPPLRQRKKDIPAMVAYFSRLKSSKEASLESMEALAKRLSRHSFPGNVRELESIVSLEASGLPWEWRITGSCKNMPRTAAPARARQRKR